jgi:hypothetical protein
MTSVPTQIPESDARRQDDGTPAVAPDRKTFVEPTISRPVDVLEATTFFLAGGSHPPGIRPDGE